VATLNAPVAVLAKPAASLSAPVAVL